MSTLGEVKAGAVRRCRHCGTEFHTHEKEEAFCCSGCEYVYRLIHEEDLDNFYKLQGSGSAPVGFRVFNKADYGWLKTLVEKTEASNSKQKSLKLALEGISCIGCVWLVEKIFIKQPGAKQSRIDVQQGEIELAWIPGKFDAESFANQLHHFGYSLAPRKTRRKSETKSITWRIALCGAFSLNGMMYTLPTYLGMKSDFIFSSYFQWLSAVFATLSMLIGGSYFIKRATHAALRKVVHMDLPIAIGLVVAYSASCYAFVSGRHAELLYFDFIATFVFLMLCGKWLQIYAIDQNRNRLAAIEVKPPTVSRIDDSGNIQDVDTDQLEPGDLYRLAPGFWVPVESRLVSPRACLGLDWINGESESRLFSANNRIPSGAINQGSTGIELIAGERWQDSLLYKLLASRREENTSDRIAQIWISRYLLTVMLLATVGAAVWMYLGQISTALIVFVSALVVSCPCAIGVALPLANELAISRLKLKGVFIRSGSLWNRLNKVTQIVFDKTGTLTRSRLDWTNRHILGQLNGESLSVLATLSSQSKHPVAATIQEYLLAKGLHQEMRNMQVREWLGKGMEGQKGGVVWRLGSAEWAGGKHPGTTVLSKNGNLVAELHFEDRPWADAVHEIAALRASGKTIAILSGDAEDKVRKAGEILGIPEKKRVSQANPEAKAKWLEIHDGETTLILGDGANDSLAFDAALCCGTPAAEKTTLAAKADFYYIGAGIQGVRKLLDVAAQRKLAVYLLMVFALGYNAITISLALAGIITPLLAAILMPISSVVSLLIVWGALRKP